MAHDTEKLRELLERCEKASGPDRELDGSIATAIGGFSLEKRGKDRKEWFYPDDGRVRREFYGVFPLPRYTASLDASIALVERVLPGWWWKVGTCSVSDDACIAPDFNSPIHGDRLQAQFPNVVPGSELDAGFDVDRRPAGNPALALIESLLRALISQAEGEASNA